MEEHEHHPKKLNEYATVEEANDKAIWTCLRCGEVVRIFDL